MQRQAKTKRPNSLLQEKKKKNPAGQVEETVFILLCGPKTEFVVR